VSEQGLTNSGVRSSAARTGHPRRGRAALHGAVSRPVWGRAACPWRLYYTFYYSEAAVRTSETAGTPIRNADPARQDLPSGLAALGSRGPAVCRHSSDSFDPAAELVCRAAAQPVAVAANGRPLAASLSVRPA
jgi:hypothetical protein